MDRAAAGLLLLVGVLGAIPACGCRLPGIGNPVPDSVAAARRYWQQGVAAMEQGEWAEAEALLAEAVKTNPGDVEARRHLATALRRRGAWAEAREHLDEALRLAPDDATLRATLAEVLLELDLTELARQEAEYALDLDPRMAAGWAARGKVMWAIGDLRQALADFQRGLGSAPNDRELLSAVASLYHEMNQPQRALAVLHQLLDTYLPDEQPAELLYEEGVAYHTLGRHEEALASFHLAAQRGEGSVKLFFHMAEAELFAGRYEDAARAAREALARDPAHRPSQDLLDRLELADRPGDLRR